MTGPQHTFNGLSREKHGDIGAINEMINRDRAANMAKALGEQPVASDQVVTSGLEVSAQSLRVPAANQPEFFTKPDPVREAKRRAGPPAELLNRHYSK